MNLAETFEIVRPGIVALGSRMSVIQQGQCPPIFPTILGTGFVVDERGIIVTNRHVATALQQLPPRPDNGQSPAFALVSGRVERGEGESILGMAIVDIKGYALPNSFSPSGEYYGEPMPDLAFLQLKVQGLPALRLATEPNTLRIGMPIATAGFAMGTNALVVYQRVNQVTPLLRHGIISSLYPFPCHHPHGFTTDIMTQGGESGSPIFLPDSPTVVGLLHAGFNGTNITLGIPSVIVNAALESSLEVAPLDLSDVPMFESLREQHSGRSSNLTWDIFSA